MNLLGDLNGDTNINILDVIILVNIILGQEPDPYELYVGDVNEDGLINILDIILIVNIILNR